MSEETRIIRALISVSDKTGLVDFAEGLAKHKVRILSTGGSAKMLRDAGIAVTDVSDHTGFPEIMDGRVKTLHPTIHGGILSVRDNQKHRVAMESHGISQIDLVVVNLYPFVETVASGADYDTCIENIDIGGPAMIRAAAKNHKYVTIVTDPAEYGSVLKDMDENNGSTSLELRQFLAREAYGRTSGYDSAISNWLAGEQGESWPKRYTISGHRKQILRYGENPHQEAAVYTTNPARKGVTTAEQIQGKELSFNNLNDADAAFEAVSEYDKPAIVIVKHANPCGIAQADTLLDCWAPALACDPTSAFGGIVAMNRELDADLAEKLTELFLEVVIAPSITEAAKEVLSAKKNLRVMVTGGMPDPTDSNMQWRTLSGGLLVQNRDNGVLTREDCKVVTKREPTEKEWTDMLFAWKVAKHVKSNAIIYARDEATVGIGAGQMSRIDSSKIAASKSSEHQGTENSVVASDAFFPFADGLIAAVNAGATAAIHPGGSMRDEEVIKAADEAGIAMVYTGMRHFKH